MFGHLLNICWGHTVLSFTQRWFRYTQQMWMIDRQMISWQVTLKRTLLILHSALLVNNHEQLQKSFRSTLSLHIS